jgi:hypothetical protein
MRRASRVLPRRKIALPIAPFNDADPGFVGHAGELRNRD